MSRALVVVTRAGVPPVGSGYAELRAQNGELRAEIARLRDPVVALTARIAELEHEVSGHSGNSGKPPSSDNLTEWAAQNEERLSRNGGVGPVGRPRS